MGSCLRPRMHRLPTEQTAQPPQTNPPVQDPHGNGHPPVSNNRPRSHHPTSPVPRRRRHPNDCGPRLQQSSHLPPLQNDDHRRGHRPTLHEPRLPIVRVAGQGHFRPRPSIHLPLRKGVDPNTRDPTEHLDGLPSSDRWTDGKEESVGGRISPTPDHGATERLGRLAGDRHCSAQPLLQCNHQDRSHRGPTRLSPPS